MEPRNIIGFAIGPILSGLLGVITLPVLAWNFAPADIARLAMLQLATNLGVIIFSLGVDQAYVRDFHEVDSKNRPRLFVASLLPGLSLFIVFACVILTLIPGLPSALFFDRASVGWSFGLLAATLAALISRFLSLILRMQEKGLAFSLSQSLPKVLFLIVVVGAWLFNAASFNLLLVANVGTMAAVLLAYSVMTRADWLPGVAASLDWNAMWRMLRFGAPLVFGGLASFAVMTLDKVLLRRLSTLEELGVYSVSASIASAVGIATVLFTTIWVPTVYKWHAQGDAWPRVMVVSKHASAAVCIALSLAGLLSPLVAYVLPGGYSLVPALIPACMMSPLLYALSEATAVGIGIGRKSVYSMIASLLGAVCGLSAGVFLVPGLGARGAAISAVIASVVFLLARTEFAGMAWRRMPRMRIYLESILFGIIASAYALSDPAKDHYWILVWSVVLVGVILSFRESVFFAFTTLRRLLLARGESQYAN